MVFRRQTGIKIRPMTAADLPSVLDIERASFSNPWSEDIFTRELHVPQARNLVAVPAGGGVAGYLMGWSVAGEFHLGNIAVAAGYRRRGIAGTLLKKVLGSPAGRQKYQLATLEVRTGNAPAQALYEKHGFKPVAIRKNYYSDTGEDALVMLRQADGGPGGMAHVLHGSGSPSEGK